MFFHFDCCIYFAILLNDFLGVGGMTVRRLLLLIELSDRAVRAGGVLLARRGCLGQASLSTHRGSG